MADQITPGTTAHDTHLTPALLDAAVRDATQALARGLEADWNTRALGLEWSCRRTAEHIADCHVSYALLVAGRRTDSYLPIDLTLSGRVEPRAIIEVLEGTGALLSAVLATSPADAVVWHPYGRADLSAVAGMGIIETLVHTWDITQTLGVDFTPTDEVCAQVVLRMFPEAEVGDDPWQTLLWATGRAELPGRPQRGDWQWTNDLSV